MMKLLVSMDTNAASQPCFFIEDQNYEEKSTGLQAEFASSRHKAVLLSQHPSIEAKGMPGLADPGKICCGMGKIVLKSRDVERIFFKTGRYALASEGSFLDDYDCCASQNETLDPKMIHECLILGCYAMSYLIRSR